MSKNWYVRELLPTQTIMRSVLLSVYANPRSDASARLPDFVFTIDEVFLAECDGYAVLLAMMDWLLLLLFCAWSQAYYDAGSLTHYGLHDGAGSYAPLSELLEPTQAIAWNPTSLETALASITEAPEGHHEIFYSIYYTDKQKGLKIGKGVFKRGVFAEDPPIFPTCKDCDAASRCTNSPTAFTSTVSTTPARVYAESDQGFTGCLRTSRFSHLLPPIDIHWRSIE
ncbi:uncharacterized protein AB675_6682 [Cyphellophora attinorum]|uniref:Uncharacterized protein n=1 Tax=Cyphellophora attinorum TaxID=1664694 RepID=A0A0N1P0S3_9EURO|nr:uncharacterized protein AB675_6682 [Phialophora attinorum]KPI43244.1 hypothetical protein AB675_6682 [Phialophora attinorum]